MPSRRHFALAMFALFAAAGHGASWVYPGWWWPAWIGHICLITFAVQATPKWAFGGGLLIGMGINAGGFFWAPNALELCLDASEWLAYVIFAALIIWEGLAFGVFCGLVAWGCKAGIRGLWWVPCAFVAAEFWWPKIFPWMIGYSQLELLPLLQIAELTGSSGISFTMTALATIPVAIAWTYRERSSTQSLRQGIAFIACATTVFLSAWWYGTLRLHELRTAQADAPQLRVAVLQVDTSHMESEQKLRERTIALGKQVDLVCWPESAIGTYCRELTDFRNVKRTLALSRESHQSLRPTLGCACDVLVGGKAYRSAVPEAGPYTQTAFLIDPQEQIGGSYHKRTLMPFGEYIPGDHYFPGLRHWATLRESMESGESVEPLATSAGAKLGIVICYEDLLRDNARRTVQAGAEVLVSLVNGFSFENPLTLVQHQRLAALRAVENRRYFLRSASTGVTCVIAPTGEILASLPVNTEGQLMHNVPLYRWQTIYTRYGEWFAYACTLLVMGQLMWLRKRGAAAPSPIPMEIV